MFAQGDPPFVLVNTLNSSVAPNNVGMVAFQVDNAAGVFGGRTAARFTVEGAQDYPLISLTVPIAYFGRPGVLRVSIAADADGLPGATLEVLSENEFIWPAWDSTRPIPATTLRSATRPVLNAGGTYWVVVELTATTYAGDARYYWTRGDYLETRPLSQQWLYPDVPSWVNAPPALSLGFKIEARVDADNDGVSDPFDYCPGTPAAVPTGALGCSDGQTPDLPGGAAGPAGPMGPAGPQGEPGLQGANGLDGAPGPQGPTGPAGTAGAPGPVGPQGVTGPKGDRGDVGPAGPQGLQGERGAAGPAGPAGPAGADGVNGRDGVDGAPGGQGPAGPQGPAGTNGVDGRDGADGAPGVAGPQGPAGTNGADGRDGIDGAPGAAGPQGPAGAEGAPGLNGRDGVDGAAGPVGPQGPAGTNGLNGRDGVNGAPGPMGPAGPAGPQGPAGVAGTGAFAGSLQLVVRGTPVPTGYTRIGSYRQPLNGDSRRSRDGRSNDNDQVLTIDIYRKN